MLYKDDRLALFIDGISLKNAARCNEIHVDFKKLRDEFSRRGRLVRTFFYTPVMEGDDYNNARRLIDFLDYNGFTLKTRSVRDTDNGTGFRKAISYLHVQMTTDALQLADQLDHVVLMCGENGIIPLAQALKRLGVRVSVCSTRQGIEGAMVSDELRREADNFIELGDLKDVCAMEREAA